MEGRVEPNAAFDNIITQHPGLMKLKSQASIIAQRNIPVLIIGETGTGKELFARAIHNSSPRTNNPFLTVNCGAIPSELIDSSLFGHVKGAFTGAISDKTGFFEDADGGTLFLDEFGELPLNAQVRLLRVLQDGTMNRVGDTQEKKVDVRVVAATNKNLLNEVAQGRFREDLYYRIAVGVLQLPPLRDRTGDLGLLCDVLLSRINQEAKDQPGYKHKKISVKAKNLILQHAWPGNIRELHATLIRASLWNSGNKITEGDIKEAIFQQSSGKDNILNKELSKEFNLQAVMTEVAKHYIEKALNVNNGHKTKAAENLGLKNYQTLTNWMKKYNIEI